LTAPPLPASPCLRAKLDYTNTDGFLAGSRFYLSYSGSAPTAGNCIPLAGDIEAAWLSHLATAIAGSWALTEVDVLDIASDSGSSGQWTGSEAGTNGTPEMPAQCATNVEFDIARRYRGGKPRMFLPAPSDGALLSDARFTTDFVALVNTGIAAFFTEIEALSIGAVGTLAHVNLSYYQGFTNVTNSSGRTRAAPKYRTTALVEAVQSYACKQVIGSQKRRRTAITY
jgi:hypothetical protein